MIEKDMLQLTEPFAGLPSKADFIPLSVEGGAQALLAIGMQTDPMDRWPGSVLLKEVAAGRSMSKQQVTDALMRFVNYRSKLIEFGWEIPELHETQVVFDEGCWCGWILERYIRCTSVDSLMRSQRYDRDFRVSLLVSVIDRVVGMPVGTGSVGWGTDFVLELLSVGLDLKPTNLVVECDSYKVLLVDQFPPLIQDEDGAVQGYSRNLHLFPAKKLLALCFTVVGSLARFGRLIQMAAISRFDFRSEFLEAIERSSLDHASRLSLTLELECDFAIVRSFYDG